MQSSWDVEMTKWTDQDSGYGECQDKKRKRRPFVKQDSLGQDSDIEEDGLGVTGIEQSQLDGPPKRVRLFEPMYAAGKFRRPFKRSDSERLSCIFACFMINTDYSVKPPRSLIKIGHPLQDHVLGDDLGAVIESYPCKDKFHNVYFLHFFTDIEQRSVAQHLTLREYDELVLLNDEFVPSMTHDQLVAKFKALPVDSHTSLKMIIRRMHKEHDIKEMEFQWIQIQAMLVPEYDREPKTIVKECRTETLRSAPSGMKKICLKLQDSTKYMSIQNHKIGTCLLQGDESDSTTYITMQWRISVPTQGDQQICWLASLHSDQNGYVSVKDQEVNLSEQQFEFTQFRDADQILFKVKDKYLGYDGDAITLKPQMYKFEPFPVKNLKFQPNSSFSSQSSGYSSFEVDDI